MIVDIEFEQLVKTAAYLGKDSKMKRVMLPEDPMGCMIAPIDSPSVRNVLEEEDLARYWQRLLDSRVMTKEERRYADQVVFEFYDMRQA